MHTQLPSSDSHPESGIRNLDSASASAPLALRSLGEGGSSVRWAPSAADYDEFMLYPAAQRSRITLWMAELEPLIERLAQRGTGHRVQCELRALARRMGVGLGTARRYYDGVRSGRKLRRSGRVVSGWRALVDHTRLTRTENRLPSEFIDYWQGMVLEHQRSARAAWHELVRRWRSGDYIPGYGTWQQHWTRTGMTIDASTLCPPELPEGWSYSTLIHHQPPKVDRALARHGIAAAMEELPHIIGTRVGLRPLEFIAFDDAELDFLVMVDGVDRPCKLKGLFAMDVATGMWLRFGLRPSVPREDGCEDGLKLRDMKRLVAELLMQYGFPLDYICTLIVERGTATLQPGDRAAIHELSGGQIRVSPTQMFSGRVLDGGFSDRAVGKARAKGWIESGFNLLHNTLASLPGQKGKSYQDRPKELDGGRVAHATALQRAGKTLPLAMREQLRLPFRNLREAFQDIQTALLTINSRRDRDLEGFEEVPQWRLSEGDQWHDYEELLQLPPAMMDRVLTRTVIESPVERWRKLSAGVHFGRMPESAVHLFLETHAQVEVIKHQIQFRHDGKAYTYFDGESPLLAINGREFLAYFNPNDMDVIYLTDARGSYKGKLPRWQPVARGQDAVALAERSAEARRILNARISAVNERMRGRNEQTVADMEHNCEVLSDAMAVTIAPEIEADIAGAAPVVAGLATAAVGRATEQAAHRAAERDNRNLEAAADAAIRAAYRPTISEDTQQGDAP